MEGNRDKFIKVSVVTEARNVEAVVWRRRQSAMSEQDVDDVAFLTGTNVQGSDCQNTATVPKKSLYENNGVVVCSQKRALFIATIVFAVLFAASLIIAYTGPQSGKIYIPFLKNIKNTQIFISPLSFILFISNTAHYKSITKFFILHEIVSKIVFLFVF